MPDPLALLARLADVVQELASGYAPCDSALHAAVYRIAAEARATEQPVTCKHLLGSGHINADGSSAFECADCGYTSVVPARATEQVAQERLAAVAPSPDGCSGDKQGSPPAPVSTPAPADDVETVLDLVEQVVRAEKTITYNLHSGLDTFALHAQSVERRQALRVSLDRRAARLAQQDEDMRIWKREVERREEIIAGQDHRLAQFEAMAERAFDVAIARHGEEVRLESECSWTGGRKVLITKTGDLYAVKRDVLAALAKGGR